MTSMSAKSAIAPRFSEVDDEDVFDDQPISYFDDPSQVDPVVSTVTACQQPIGHPEEPSQVDPPSNTVAARQPVVANNEPNHVYFPPLFGHPPPTHLPPSFGYPPADKLAVPRYTQPTAQYPHYLPGLLVGPVPTMSEEPNMGRDRDVEAAQRARDARRRAGENTIYPPPPDAQGPYNPANKPPMQGYPISREPDIRPSNPAAFRTEPAESTHTGQQRFLPSINQPRKTREHNPVDTRDTHPSRGSVRLHDAPLERLTNFDPNTPTDPRSPVPTNTNPRPQPPVPNPTNVNLPPAPQPRPNPEPPLPTGETPIPATDFSPQYLPRLFTELSASPILPSILPQGLHTHFSHLACSFLAHPSAPAPTLAELKKHAQALCLLITVLGVTREEIADGGRREVLDFLPKLTVPYEPVEGAVRDREIRPLQSLVNTIAVDPYLDEGNWPTGPSTRLLGCPGHPAHNNNDSVGRLLRHANDILETIDGTLWDSGGLLAAFPQFAEHLSEDLRIEVGQARAMAEKTLVGQWIKFTQGCVERVAELEREVCGLREWVGGGRMLPGVVRGGKGRGKKRRGNKGKAKANGKGTTAESETSASIAEQSDGPEDQDDYVLAGLSSTLYTRLQTELNNRETAAITREQNARRRGYTSASLRASRSLEGGAGNEDENRTEGEQDAAEDENDRNWIPPNITSWIECTSRIYRVRGRETLYVVQAWDLRPGGEKVRAVEQGPLVLSVPVGGGRGRVPVPVVGGENGERGRGPNGGEQGPNGGGGKNDGEGAGANVGANGGGGADTLSEIQNLRDAFDKQSRQLAMMENENRALREQNAELDHEKNMIERWYSQATTQKPPADIGARSGDGNRPEPFKETVPATGRNTAATTEASRAEIEKLKRDNRLCEAQLKRQIHLEELARVRTEDERAQKERAQRLLEEAVERTREAEDNLREALESVQEQRREEDGDGAVERAVRENVERDRRERYGAGA